MIVAAVLRSVTYQITTKIRHVVHCHRVTCRKAHGAAFSSVASVPQENFVLQGGSNLNSYESSPGKHRFFCHLRYSDLCQTRQQTHIILRLVLDTPVQLRACTHLGFEAVDWFDMMASCHVCKRHSPPTMRVLGRISSYFLSACPRRCPIAGNVVTCLTLHV